MTGITNIATTCAGRSLLSDVRSAYAMRTVSFILILLSCAVPALMLAVVLRREQGQARMMTDLSTRT